MNRQVEYLRYKAFSFESLRNLVNSWFLGNLVNT